MNPWKTCDIRAACESNLNLTRAGARSILAKTVDKNPAYPPAIDELKNEKNLFKNVEIRQIKYLNNIIEQDHRSIKRIVNPMLGFQSFRSANQTLKGIEAMNMIKKRQVNDLNYSVFNEVKYINQLFGNKTKTTTTRTASTR